MPRKKRKPKPLEELPTQQIQEVMRALGSRGGEQEEPPKKQIRQVMRALGSKGGKTTGKSKARTSEQARAAVNARWAKERAKKAKVDTPPSGECPPPP